LKTLRTNWSHGFKAFLPQNEKLWRRLIENGGRLGKASGKFGISSETRYYPGLPKSIERLLMSPVSMLNMSRDIKASIN
jgi:hypothetical protein